MILVTNDDGIDSDGLKALASALEDIDKVIVVAPDRERSAISHALTLHRPLRVEKVKSDWYAVDGTPADCVHIAVKALLSESPWLVASGINRGANLGDDIIYSGTVAGAVEAVLLGIQAFAISLAGRSDLNFDSSAKFARSIAGFLKRTPMPPNTFLNVNVPHRFKAENPVWKLTRQGQRVYRTEVVLREDPRGNPYYWIGGQEPDRVEEEGTDIDAVEKGYISITPLHLDMTAYSLIEEYQRVRAKKV